MQGDCLEVMPTLESGSIDAIICDLPYGVTSCKWDTVIPFEPLWVQYKRLIKPRGAVVLFAGSPFNYRLYNTNPEWFRHEWIWDKGVGMGQNAKRMPIRTHEFILVFSESLTNYHPQMEKKIHIRPHPKTRKTELMDLSACRRDLAHLDSGLKYPVSVLAFSGRMQEINTLNRFHPTQKPIALLEYLIRTYTNPGNVVLDNCMGSGSTGVACINTDRHFIGIELDAGYFTMAQARIDKAQAQPVQMEMAL